VTLPGDEPDGHGKCTFGIHFVFGFHMLCCCSSTMAGIMRMFSKVIPREEGSWTGMLVLTFTACLTWKE